MKDYYLRVSDKILPAFSEMCKVAKCKHPICECGHCSRNYHIGRTGECVKINPDLSTCGCKKFIVKSILKEK